MRSPRFFLIVLLICAFILRLELVLHGGQFFHPDEFRYLTSQAVAKELSKGHYDDALTQITSTADHLGFKVIGILPALVEIKYGKNNLIPALFFSFFSWINIVILWFLALRLGADEWEAFFAAFLAATANSLFYYAAHLFPYDPALTFGLLALYVGLRRQGNWLASIGAGLLAFLAFFTYNGYWALAAFGMLVHVCQPPKSVLRLAQKSILTGLGFLVPLGLVIWLSWQYDNNLWDSYLGFSNTITAGLYSEGGSLPFAYLWASEQGILIIWLGLSSYALVRFRALNQQRILTWLAGIVFIYLCLAIPSVLLHKFVVYGRLVRQMVPFLALAGAYGLKSMEALRRFGRLAVGAVLAFVLVQAGLNFRPLFLLTYPLDFVKAVQQRYPNFQPPKSLTYFYNEDVVDVGPYRAYYIKYLFPIPEEPAPLMGEILMRARNPLSYPPFMFEGHTPLERARMLSGAFDMLVVKNSK